MTCNQLYKPSSMFTEPTFLNPKIEVKKSCIQGRGMFTKEMIEEGEVVIRWGGEFLTKAEVISKNRADFLIIQIDEDLWSVEKRGEYEDDYYINHSCDANTWMIDGRTFVAKKTIEKDSEITVDYALFESDEYISRWECNCTASECRKKITGRDCFIPSVQARYSQHFSPMVQKRIENNIGETQSAEGTYIEQL